MASIYARNGILQIKYKNEDGAWQRKSTKLEDTKANRVLVRDKLVPAIEKALVEKVMTAASEPFGKYAKLYLKTVEHHKTYWEYDARVKTIVTYFEGRDIREIQVSELRTWVHSLHKSHKTVRGYMSNCRGIFDIAMQEELIEKNPFVHISNPKNNDEVDEIEPFTSEEVMTLLSHAEDDIKAFLAIGFFSGLRAGEILGLQVSDIEDGFISVRRSISKGAVTTPKTRKSVRRVPLFDVLKPYLKEQIEKSRTQKSLWLFSREGKHVYGVETIRGKKPYGAWAALLSNVEFTYRAIKNTRHTFIVAMLRSGELSVLEIAQMVGHTNTKMIIEHYAKYIDGEQLKIDRAFNPFDDGHSRGHNGVHTHKIGVSLKTC